MATEQTNEEQLTAAMARPKSMTVDGTSATQHSLKEMQDAQERIAASQAARRPARSLRSMLVKLRMPGAS